ncbi:MAG: lipoyl synthase [Bdellovibrionales bacterium]|nr:lipoyl synthase [Bdellovibrionales bacterium]
MLTEGTSSPAPAAGRKPEWLKRPPGSASETRELKLLLRKAKLNTVCEEARCPNISECFSRGTATFMILGDVCTRGCRFCSVTTGRPHMPAVEFAAEGDRVAEAAQALGLSHVVVTSVARDDLADGGASGFAATVAAIRSKLAGVTVEVLVPDFRGSFDSLHRVLDAGPDVFNHNLETVPRLYRRVRPGAVYKRSLELLAEAKRYCPDVISKTGVMLGLGERREEVLELLDDCRSYQVESFTAGQYMQPTRGHLPVEEYVSPQEFALIESEAHKRGFTHVAVGPLVRSSYHADEFITK